MEFHCREQRLSLLPDRVVYWHEARTLLLADAHWGKGSAFRRAGIPLMETSTADDLARLSHSIARLRAERIIFLGDLLHSRSGRSPDVMETIFDWRRSLPHVGMILVRGNHDRQAGDPPPEWNIACVAEPYCEGPFAFRHYPEPTPLHYTFSGHIHPGVALHGKGRQRLKLPCFHFGPEWAVLPAFGSLTGLAAIRPVEGDSVYAVAEGEVMEIKGVVR